MPTRIEINNDLRPAYYDDFRCLAAGCRYSCCKGWRISFNKKDYLSLKRQEGSEEFNARMDHGLRRIRKGAEGAPVHVPEHLLIGFPAGRLGALAADRLVSVYLQHGQALAFGVLHAGPDLGIYTGLVLLV